MALPKDLISEVIKYCNRDLVPDSEFSAEDQYHSQWFEEYFSFLSQPNIESQLGDAFYQARFVYKLMNALHLPLAKQRGIVKFQIVQYASICEAVLDVAIQKYFLEEAEEEFSVVELTKISNALSSDTKISYQRTEAFLCREKKKKGVLKRTRIDRKTEFGVSKGLIEQETKEKMDKLYDLRNNIHILKAANSQYNPKRYEAKNAFLLMQEFVGEIKEYYSNH